MVSHQSEASRFPVLKLQCIALLQLMSSTSHPTAPTCQMGVCLQAWGWCQCKGSDDGQVMQRRVSVEVFQGHNFSGFIFCVSNIRQGSSNRATLHTNCWIHFRKRSELSEWGAVATMFRYLFCHQGQRGKAEMGEDEWWRMDEDGRTSWTLGCGYF